MATSYIIFLIGFLSVLHHVAALPTNKKAAVLSQPKNCIQMTKENEEKINQIVFKVSEYLYNVSVEYDIFDIYLLQIGIEKYVEGDDDEKEVEMKLMINDCATVHPDGYYKSTMDLKFDGDNSTVSEHKKPNTSAQTKLNSNDKGIKKQIKNVDKKFARFVGPKQPKEGNKQKVHSVHALTGPKDHPSKKDTKEKSHVNKDQKSNNKTSKHNNIPGKDKPKENSNIKHNYTENDDKVKKSKKINGTNEIQHDKGDTNKNTENPAKAQNQNGKSDSKDKNVSKTNYQQTKSKDEEHHKKPANKNVRKEEKTKENHGKDNRGGKHNENSEDNRGKSRESGKNINHEHEHHENPDDDKARRDEKPKVNHGKHNGDKHEENSKGGGKSHESGKNINHPLRPAPTNDKENNLHAKDKGERKSHNHHINDELDKNANKADHVNDNNGKSKGKHHNDKNAKKSEQAKEHENKSHDKGIDDSIARKTDKKNEKNPGREHSVDENDKKDKKSGTIKGDSEKPSEKAKNDKKSKNKVSRDESKYDDGPKKRDVGEDRDSNRKTSHTTNEGKPANKIKEESKYSVKSQDFWDSGDTPVLMELNLDENGEKLIRALEEKRSKLWPLLMYVQNLDGKPIEYLFLNNK